MDQKRLKKLLDSKEGMQLEFKTASTDQLPKNLFESICGMLNREGGDIRPTIYPSPSNSGNR
jgi:ATP-dependent DNA helicase RecG